MFWLDICKDIGLSVLNRNWQIFMNWLFLKLLFIIIGIYKKWSAQQRPNCIFWH